MQTELNFLPPRAEMERAFLEKDASFDGLFWFGVKTTGIFCRPSCRAKPHLSNIEFFASVGAACEAGYRACKRCAPLESRGELPVWAKKLVETDVLPNEVGVSGEVARTFFESRFGLSFSRFKRAQKMATAFLRLRAGESLDAAIFWSGHDSHSGFREAFQQLFGAPPGQIEGRDFIATTFLESPIGALWAGANESGIVFLEPCDRTDLKTRRRELETTFGAPLLPAPNCHLEKLQSELRAYFDGKCREFSTSISPRGSEFQKRVWDALREIPSGQTRSYEQIALQIGAPGAVRAVARANATNRIYLLIPCHRVVGKNGELSGYGGGVWRKRLLLEWEKLRA